MRLTSILSTLAFGLLGMSAVVLADDAMQIAVSHGNTQAGDGQNVTFKGNPLPLSGKGIKVGDAMPSAMKSLLGSTDPVADAMLAGSVFHQLYAEWCRGRAGLVGI